MSFLSRLLSLTTPAAQTAEQTAAADAIRSLNERIDAELMAMPDTKEELAEEQDDWVERWDALMDESINCVTEAGRVGIEPRLNTEIVERMKQVDDCVKGWTKAANERKAERLEREQERIAIQLQRERTMNNATERARGSSDDSSSTTGSSDSSSDSPVEMAQMQPEARMTVLPHNSMPPVAPTPTEKKDKAPMPVKTAPAPSPVTGPSEDATAEGELVHRVPCDRCRVKREECRGYPDRTCERCARLKAQCNKSLGRGKAKGAIEEEKGSKGKGKRPARMANRKPFPNPPRNLRKRSPKVISLDSSGNEDAEGEDVDEEEQPARPRKKVKVAHPEPGAEDMRVAGVLALKKLKGKIMTVQGRIKAAEGELGTMGVEMGRLVREFADVETALGM